MRKADVLTLGMLLVFGIACFYIGAKAATEDAGNVLDELQLGEGAKILTTLENMSNQLNGVIGQLSTLPRH